MTAAMSAAMSDVGNLFNHSFRASSGVEIVCASGDDGHGLGFPVLPAVWSLFHFARFFLKLPACFDWFFFAAHKW